MVRILRTHEGLSRGSAEGSFVSQPRAAVTAEATASVRKVGPQIEVVADSRELGK